MPTVAVSKASNLWQIVSCVAQGLCPAADRRAQQPLIALANRPVSLLITDMHRKTEPRGAQPAGITFLQERRRRLPPVQAVVYCAPVSVKQYREQAQAEGAQLVTASPTDLLAYIGQVFGL